jgi:hypothetical protein
MIDAAADESLASAGPSWPSPLAVGPALALAGSLSLLAAVGLAFYWLPSDVDQGFSQRIFYPQGRSQVSAD